MRPQAEKKKLLHFLLGGPDSQPLQGWRELFQETGNFLRDGCAALLKETQTNEGDGVLFQEAGMQKEPDYLGKGENVWASWLGFCKFL